MGTEGEGGDEEEERDWDSQDQQKISHSFRLSHPATPAVFPHSPPFPLTTSPRSALQVYYEEKGKADTLKQVQQLHKHFPAMAALAEERCGPRRQALSVAAPQGPR